MNKSKSGKKLFCKSIKTEDSFIQQLFIETYFVLGTVLGARDTVSRTGKILTGLYFRGDREAGNKQTKKK